VEKCVDFWRFIYMVDKPVMIDTPKLPKVGYKAYIVNTDNVKEKYTITEIADNAKRFKMTGPEGKILTAYLSKENIWRVLGIKIDVDFRRPIARSKRGRKRIHPFRKKINKFFKIIGLY
jgi:hypothetical protein